MLMTPDEENKSVNPATVHPARQLLVSWSNNQDAWVRAITAEVIATRQPLTEAAINRICEIFLAEKKLSEDELPLIPQLSADEGIQDPTERLELTKLHKISNVNALAPNQEIEFHPNLTVLFGQNAAGKTGYVRILKRLAGVRAVEIIIANIFSIADDSIKPKAEINYKFGDDSLTLNWENESGISPFTRMSVFDTRAMAIHLDSDLTYVYTPGDLALFRYVHTAIETVKRKLDERRISAAPRSNPFFTRFNRDTQIYPLMEALGPTSDIKKFEELASVSNEEESTLEALRERMGALQPQAAQKALQNTRSDCDFFRNVLKTTDQVLEIDTDKYNELYESEDKALKTYEQSKNIFDENNLPGLQSKEWMEFIKAGEEYINHYDSHEYPLLGSECIYCRQPLAESAMALIKKYRNYSSGSLAKEAETKSKNLTTYISPISSIELSYFSIQLSNRIAPDNETPDNILAIKEFFEELTVVQNHLTNKQLIDWSVLKKTAEKVKNILITDVEQSVKLIQELESKAEERQQALISTARTLRELEARLLLRNLLTEIKDFVKISKWVQNLNQLITTRFPVITRELTNVSKTASEEMLNKDFERHFLQECRSLRAPNVQLDFPGRKGQPERRKTVADGQYHLSDVLSEGEQKVIALADFLAEAGMRASIAPIIFDDPVNSLDYLRITEVVDRIVELSQTHQVIIFTHNIWFATEILSRFEKNPKDCYYYSVEDNESVKGIITRGTHPRSDTVKNLISRVNKLIQDAAGQNGETQSALVEKGYEVLRSWCEAVVETDLLCEVTKRYQPNVMMTKLPQIKADRLKKAVEAIMPVFEKACRIIASHSQPLETLNVRPNLQQLKQDWTTLQEARKAYLEG